jgi:hypothetical protein
MFPNNATKPKLLPDAPKPGHGNVTPLLSESNKRAC